jgi:hypothetical protein
VLTAGTGRRSGAPRPASVVSRSLGSRRRLPAGRGPVHFECGVAWVNACRDVILS